VSDGVSARPAFPAAFSVPLPAVSRSSVRGFFDPDVVNPPWKVRNTTPFLSASTKKNLSSLNVVRSVAGTGRP